MTSPNDHSLKKENLITWLILNMDKQGIERNEDVNEMIMKDATNKVITIELVTQKLLTGHNLIWILVKKHHGNFRLAQKLNFQS